MTQCERLSDRMPEVALGRSVWSAAEQQHLDECADCLSEWKLVEMTARLGDSLPQSHDPESISASVLGRLAAERTNAGTRRRRWLAGVLAAAAVAIIAVRVPHPAVPRLASPGGVPAPAPGATTSGQTLPLPELDDLPASELESILGVLDDSSGVSRSFDDPGLDDFDDHDFDRALGALES